MVTGGELSNNNANEKISEPKYSLPKVQRTQSLLDQLRNQSAAKTRRCGFKRGIIFLLIAFLIATLILTSYLCRQDVNPFLDTESLQTGDRHRRPLRMVTYDEMVPNTSSAPVHFNMAGQDVMVFLHIQKTGGTIFGKHLVKDINLKRRCECSKGWKNGRRKKMRCACLRPGQKEEKSWLFSRYSTGWKCGLHPDWTELVGCVDAYLNGLEGDSLPRRYFYISFLREPVARYLSEFRHVQRGATWKTASHMCGGRSWTDIIPKCYQDTSGDSDWSGVQLEEFMQCDHNLAVNRQTRMLADLELVNCYNKSGLASERRDKQLLASAKSNLERLAYFGLTEQQQLSQYLFEKTFQLEFRVPFQQLNTTHSSTTTQELASGVLERIQQINSLDMELYSFASNLLQQRAKQWKNHDPNYQDHMKRLSAKVNKIHEHENSIRQQQHEEEEDEEEDEETYDSH